MRADLEKLKAEGGTQKADEAAEAPEYRGPGLMPLPPGQAEWMDQLRKDMLAREWPDPTAEELKDETFELIWQCIKTWDVGVSRYYAGYMGAIGNHAAAILHAIEPVRQRTRDTAAAFKRVHEENVELRAKLEAEKQKNLLDRKLFIFAACVQTWLAVDVQTHVPGITRCRAAWIQSQAFLVSPSVLGELGAAFNKEGSLAWQACDFVKTLCKEDQWPTWTILR